MKCLIGFILFWIAVGIFISLFIDLIFWKVVLVMILMIVGFNLFCY